MRRHNFYVYLLKIKFVNVKTFAVFVVLYTFVSLKNIEMSKETQECIIEKASALFYRYGIRSITMDFIASELGMSKRTLYENFENKDALIVACLERDHQRQSSEMRAIFESDANTIEKMVRCYNCVIGYIGMTSRSFQFDVTQMRSKVNEEVSVYREKQFKFIRNLLSIGVKEGLVRDNLNLDIVTFLHNGQVDWVHKLVVPGSNDLNFAEVLRVYTRIFLYGIVTDKGRKVLDENYEQITQTL